MYRLWATVVGDGLLFRKTDLFKTHFFKGKMAVKSQGRADKNVVIAGMQALPEAIEMVLCPKEEID